MGADIIEHSAGEFSRAVFVKGGSGDPSTCPGTIDSVAAAPTFTVASLAGYGNDYFNGWFAYVVWDKAGGEAAPQGESKAITDYVSSTGTFSHAGFTAPLVAGDKVLISLSDPNAASGGGTATLGNQTTIIDDIDTFTDSLFFDDHDDESLSATLWDTPVLAGSTVVTESSSAPNTLRIYNPGTGTLGAGYVPSILTFGRNTSVRSKIDMVSSVNCFARIELYKDANDYVYFGARKDGTADSRVYLWYNIAGAGEGTVDINVTDTDHIAREYRVDVSEENLMFYVDNVLVYTLKDTTLDDYYIRPYAASFVNANVLDIRFDYNVVLRLAEDSRAIYKQLLAIQGGTDSLGAISATLANQLDLGHYEGAVTPSDATENDIYDSSSDRVFDHGTTLVDLTNMEAADTIEINLYKHVDSTTEILVDTKPFNGVQTLKGIEIGAGYGVNGIRIALKQTAGTYREFKYLNIDGVV